MIIRNIIIHSFVFFILAFSACTALQEKPQERGIRIPDGFGESLIQIKIEIVCNKSEVSINDSITFDVRILNSPIDDNYCNISVFNPVKLGVTGGLTITVIGPEGNEIFPKEETDGHAVQPLIDDSWQYSILHPNHYLGAIYKDSVKNIFRTPGKYFVYAEYLSPVNKDEVKKPEYPFSDEYESDPFWNFWGREIGPIRSAPLEINVIK